MKRQKGLTLIETLFVVGIISIIGGIIFQTLTVGKNSLDRANRVVRVQQETRKAMNYIIKELRQAIVDTITTPVFNAAVPTTATQIIFKISNGVNVNGDVIPSEIITYKLDGTRILREPPPPGLSEDVVANNITVFNITRPALANNPNQRRVDIDIQASHNNGFDTVTSRLSSQVMVRN